MVGREMTRDVTGGGNPSWGAAKAGVPVLPRWHECHRALGPLVTLAGPVVLAEVGWMSMTIVDTIMVSPLGPEAIGAVGAGSMLFMALSVFAMGLLLGLDPLVSQAWGRQRLDECHRWLFHGVALAVIVTLPVLPLVAVAAANLDVIGLHPAVERFASPYLAIVNLSLLPLLLYAAFRRYLQGIGLVRPVMVALLTANVFNAGANWLLIEGRLGLPALGTAGAAWATCVSRTYMAVFLLVVILWHDRLVGGGLRFTVRTLERARFGHLLRLGVPAALQLTLEVGVFAVATMLAGRLLPVSLAAHQIALNIAGLTFMVPLGLSAAGAVSVGHAIGRGSGVDARTRGWTALLLVVVFMSGAAILFISAPAWLVRLFSHDPGVVELGRRLLWVAAVFQLFDGVQGVATGILRGLGETRSPMLWNLAGHWGLGLPVAYFLCFAVGWGVVGLWIGLSLGLILVAIVLTGVWVRRVRELLQVVDERPSADEVAAAGA